MSWPTVAIGDISNLVTKGTTPTTMGRPFTDHGVRFVKAEALNGDTYLEQSGVAFIEEETHQMLKRSILEKDDVLITIAGAQIGRCGYVTSEDLPANTNQAVGIVRINREKAVPRFVYYFFKQPGTFQTIQSIGGGQAAQPNLNLANLKQIALRLPSMREQQIIASSLSAYDDVIENNRRRMSLLEASARLLYSEWFVRLRFPGHEHTSIADGVPEGWERKALGECITLNYGKALKAEVRIDGEYPVYGSSGIVGSHEKPLVKGPAIVLGRKGNVGSVYWSSKSFYPIDTVYFVDAESSSLYLYYALKHMHFISTDVAVPGLNRDFAYSRLLLLPPTTLLCAFLETVTPIHAQLDKLDEMNQKLRAACGLLLPRLMSGEITV